MTASIIEVVQKFKVILLILLLIFRNLYSAAGPWNKEDMRRGPPYLLKNLWQYKPKK